RRTVLRTFAAVPASLIGFESPRRLAASLADMAAVLGPRPAAVARELTKFHEEVVRGPLDALAARYATTAPRGEVVVVVGPPAGQAVADDATVDRALDEALARLGPSAAAAEVARATGRSRRELYARALERAGRRPAP
ncbi:MAG: 16S rRNA (cytidine(1402)-2'-O)-methyltransferase, partial [Alphaproteobacteria bacterium]